jgi:hypothetical protein
MLTEAAFVAVSTAGPMRAFYERVRARRGGQIAIVAVARKLTVLFWHMLTRQQDYAFARPSLTRHKLRELELRAGAERHPGSRSLKHRSGYHQRPNRERERELSLQAELAYRRLVSDWKAAGPAKGGCGRDTGARIFKAVSAASSAAGLQAPATCALARRHPHPGALSQRRLQQTRPTCISSVLKLHRHQTAATAA